MPHSSYSIPRPQGGGPVFRNPRQDIFYTTVSQRLRRAGRTLYVETCPFCFDERRLLATTRACYHDLPMAGAQLPPANMRRAIYAFSGDPITYGHIDIVERAAKGVDHLVVGIGVNPAKKYTFSIEERTEMARRSLAHLPNVTVVSFQGLLVDYAYEHRIGIVIRGARNAADLDYESALHQIGDSQKLGIDTHILLAKPELAHVSSGTVKAVQKEQGSIHGYVPLCVKQCLEARISGQYIVGATGEMGSGKSHLSRAFAEIGARKGIDVHNIELDDIGHQILGELKEPRYDDVRRQIVETFGRRVELEGGAVNRKALGEIVFGSPRELDRLNRLIYTPLLVRLRREMYGKRGLIVLNAALIAESDMAYLCNNNVVLIHVDSATQEARLKKRGLGPEQMRRRLASQFTFEEKKGRLTKAIERDRNGRIWVVDSSDEKAASVEIERTLEEVIEALGVK